MSRPTIICLTPLRDERWALDRFVATTLKWADKLIIVDQGSTDGSSEYLATVDDRRVTVLSDTPQRSYDQPRIRSRLLEEARRTAGPRLLFSLDADECLTASALDPSVWESVLSAPPGTFVSVPWFQFAPGVSSGWFAEPVLAGFIDDDRPPTQGDVLHEPRFPGVPKAILPEPALTILHYQAAEPTRWRSKQRWYQCLERLEFPAKRPAELYRQYHKGDPLLRSDILEAPLEYLRGYEERGIDMRSVTVDGSYRWDVDVLEMFAARGTAPFRKLDIWDFDWVRAARDHGVALPEPPTDPRSAFDRGVLRWLRFAQPRRRSAVVRALSRSLQFVGW
jgi:hypothetical protein